VWPATEPPAQEQHWQHAALARGGARLPGRHRYRGTVAAAAAVMAVLVAWYCAAMAGKAHG
jgi:hypothetical protein